MPQQNEDMKDDFLQAERECELESSVTAQGEKSQ